SGVARASGAGGRILPFRPPAPAIVPGGTPAGRAHVYVHDIAAGTTTLVSAGVGFGEGNDHSAVRGPGLTLRSPAINGDGRYVAFHSLATDLVAGPTTTAGRVHVYRRDVHNAVTALVSIAADGGSEGNGDSAAFFSNSTVAISADGRFVAFDSCATNLAPGGTTGCQVFVRDMTMAVTQVVSVRTGGAVLGDGTSSAPALSADGHTVAYESVATNLVPADTNAVRDAFATDRSAIGRLT